MAIPNFDAVVGSFPFFLKKPKNGTKNKVSNTMNKGFIDWNNSVLVSFTFFPFGHLSFGTLLKYGSGPITWTAFPFSSFTSTKYSFTLLTNLGVSVTSCKGNNAPVIFAVVGDASLSVCFSAQSVRPVAFWL